RFAVLGTGRFLGLLPGVELFGFTFPELSGCLPASEVEGNVDVIAAQFRVVLERRLQRVFDLPELAVPQLEEVLGLDTMHSARGFAKVGFHPTITAIPSQAGELASGRGGERTLKQQGGESLKRVVLTSWCRANVLEVDGRHGSSRGTSCSFSKHSVAHS